MSNIEDNLDLEGKSPESPSRDSFFAKMEADIENLDR